MSQRRSYPGSNDFNLDDLFRPEPGQQPAQPEQQHQPIQPPVPPQQAFGEHGGPEYWSPAPQAPEGSPETQYLPPYPTNDPSAGLPPQPYGAPQQPAYNPQPGYGHQQGYAGQQAYQSGPSAYPTETFQGGGDGGRSNQKLIIGGVVGGCAALGILVAVLMSGGDDKGTTKTTPVAKTASSAPAPGSVGGNDLQSQAKAMSDLLGRASASRQSVINAVGNVGKCAALPDSQAALTQAAGQRDQLVTDLATLKVDKLPNGQQLADALKAAWQASSTADKEYASAASDAAGSCDPSKIDANPHMVNGNTASGQATQAKTQAADLWNAIASQAGQPNKSKTEL